MSRYTKHQEGKLIVYGFDRMTPMGGYFFQVFDETKKEETLLVNEGFFKGISKTRMIELMTEWNIKNKDHLTKIALDLPI